jgi:hypothetical protein
MAFLVEAPKQCLLQAALFMSECDEKVYFLLLYNIQDLLFGRPLRDPDFNGYRDLHGRGEISDADW